MLYYGLYSHPKARDTHTKDEEIFLDYGDEWEEAWLAHIKDWKPIDGAEEYVPAFHLNHHEKRLKATSDEKQNPYPSNVELHVFEQFFDPKNTWERDMKRRMRVSYLRNDTGDFAEDLRARRSVVVDLTAGTRSVDVFYVEEANDGELAYTVRDREEGKIYHGLPRLAFYFFDKAYTTDMFLESAFRHPIGIPDHLFPRAWRDLRPAEPLGETRDEL